MNAIGSPSGGLFYVEVSVTYLEKSFLIFHQQNPHVYELFKKFTKQVIDRGYKQHSARDIIHRIRWETTVVTNDGEFKVNDHHSPYYARMWMREHPEHPDFFRTRSVQEAA
jgi:hypothetical protein